MTTTTDCYGIHNFVDGRCTECHLDLVPMVLNDELCRCGHPESQHGPDGCTAPTRLIGDMTYAERPCYCETFSDCYEGDPS